MMQMVMGMWVSQIVSAIAQLGFADRMAEGLQTADEIALAAGASPQATHRLLRAATNLGVVQETAPRHFALTPLGETLRSNVPGSMRDFVIAETAPGHWLPWGRLGDAIRTGRSQSQQTLGIPIWEYYAKNPDEAASFAGAMSNLSAQVSAQVGQVYDAGEAKTIVDVGGSEGVLLRGLLQKSNARGILFDRPEIIEHSRSVIAADPLASRIELVAGDFFAEVPKGDLYILKSILHDWPDGKCVEILKTIRRAAPPDARVIIVEMLIPETPSPSPVLFLDLNMLVMLDGRERTAGEYGDLLRAGGWAVERVIPTEGMFSVVEARVA
jgi:hypothetical protein